MSGGARPWPPRWRTDRRLTMWTIYYNHPDFPGEYAVRVAFVGADGVEHSDEGWVTSTLEEARACVPDGLHNLGRTPEDHWTVLETWV